MQKRPDLKRENREESIINRSDRPSFTAPSSIIIVLFPGDATRLATVTLSGARKQAEGW